MSKKSYSGADIEVLEGLEPVRKRPGMYIAGTDTPAGLHQLVFEILDNSVDEAMNGHADFIEVTLHEDCKSVSVKDNGRGIPVDSHPKYKISTLEVILTTLHAGGKFSDKNYKTAGGLHGVGSSVVNALSEELEATVFRDGKQYIQKFSRGKSCGRMRSKSIGGRKHGTQIFFRPDPEIFGKVIFSAKTIRNTLQMKAYLNPGLKLSFINEREDLKEEFCYQNGLIAFLEEVLEKRKATPVGGKPFFLSSQDEVEVELALAWTDATREDYHSYVNGIHTIDGGSHENGARAGVVKAIRNYISVHNIPLKGIKLGAEDIREGLVCAVSVRMPGGKYQPQFQGQTKAKLNNPEIAPFVEAVARSLEQKLNQNPSASNAIVERIVLAAKARAASREAGKSVRRKIGISHRLTLPGKLADCSSSKPDVCELFIVEGDSAGGSTKQGRDRKVQAVLPLRGKVLNTIASSNKKVGDNKELSNIISALGCGSGETLDLNKLRYGKIIILTDADSDGMHIATLLMAFFFKHMPKLIDEGCLFIGMPPLYGIFPQGSAQPKAPKENGKTAPKGRKRKSDKKAYWAYSETERDNIIESRNLNSPRITRFKGLGEMNPDTLWDTTLNPETRTLLRVGVADGVQAMNHLQKLMGSDPSARYQLIKNKAMEIDIDI